MNDKPIVHNKNLAGAPPDGAAEPKGASAKAALLIALLFILSVAALLIFMNASDKKWREDYNARQAAAQKALAEYNAEGAAAARRPRPFDLAPAGQQGESGLGAFEQAVRRERPGRPQQQEEYFDYGAHVAAYEAQMKAQWEAANPPPAPEMEVEEEREIIVVEKPAQQQQSKQTQAQQRQQQSRPQPEPTRKGRLQRGQNIQDRETDSFGTAQRAVRF